jgi:hypothetical protein
MAKGKTKAPINSELSKVPQVDEQLKNAMGVIKQVCETFNGSLKQHQNIQHAIAYVEQKLKK